MTEKGTWKGYWWEHNKLPRTDLVPNPVKFNITPKYWIQLLAGKPAEGILAITPTIQGRNSRYGNETSSSGPGSEADGRHPMGPALPPLRLVCLSSCLKQNLAQMEAQWECPTLMDHMHRGVLSP